MTLCRFLWNTIDGTIDIIFVTSIYFEIHAGKSDGLGNFQLQLFYFGTRIIFLGTVVTTRHFSKYFSPDIIVCKSLNKIWNMASYESSMYLIMEISFSRSYLDTMFCVIIGILAIYNIFRKDIDSF